MSATTFTDVGYKGETGSLLLNDSLFHYTTPESSTSVKCSWAKVEKRQLSPSHSDSHMIKLVLKSGKSAVFHLPDRESLEEVRSVVQQKMNAVNQQDSEMSASFVDEPEPRRSSTRTTTVVSRSTSNQKASDSNARCAWCCFNTLLCWVLTCFVCLLIAAIIAIVYWFVLKDSDEFNDLTGQNNENPPDLGEEERYAIRNMYLDPDWVNQQDVHIEYQTSDYVLDPSVSYKLYDGMKCRNGDKDVTADNKYLFMSLTPREKGAADLNNKGRGSRYFDLRFTLNKGEITQSPFFLPRGLERGVLEFCVGFIINYNQINDFSEEQEVNFVETAFQMDVALDEFRKILKVDVKTIIPPKYQRRRLLRGGNNETRQFLDIMNVQEDGAGYTETETAPLLLTHE